MLGKNDRLDVGSGESEKKYWKRTSKETIVDEETGEEKTIFTEFDVEKKEGFESEYLNEDEEKEYGSGSVRQASGTIDSSCGKKCSRTRSRPVGGS